MATYRSAAILVVLTLHSYSVLAGEEPTSAKSPGLDKILVDGQLVVDEMELAAPARIVELSQRFAEAARKDPAWWLEHVKKAKPGAPPPYDARIGLSEKEYEEFLTAGQQVIARKRSQATLLIKKKGEGVYLFDGGQALSDLTGIEVDLVRDHVRTPFGILDKRSDVSAPDNSPLGKWTGVQWKLQERAADGVKGTTAELAIGTTENGRRIIYYDVKKYDANAKMRITRILNFDLPSGTK